MIPTKWPGKMRRTGAGDGRRYSRRELGETWR
jgi:hypothetical protein